MKRLSVLLCAPLVLAACGSGNINVVADPGPQRPIVPGPTLSLADVAQFDRDVSSLALAERTRVADLPTGTVTYDGQVGSNIELDGQSGYGILGDLRMRVEFAGSRDITGDITDINLLQGGRPIQEFGGQLLIEGEQASGKLMADADGVLSLVTDTGEIRRTNMALQLDGVVANDVFVGDAVRGQVTGFGDGYLLSGPTLNVLLDGGGAFVGEVN